MIEMYNQITIDSYHTSIINIINQNKNNNINYDNIINNIMKDTIITENTKNLLIEYCNNDETYNITQVTFTFIELLCYTWLIINTLEAKNDIKNILNLKINNNECKYFRNRIFNLINCLNGFTDLVHIITCNQQISNVILFIKQKLELENNYNIEIHKELVKKELTEKEFIEEVIDEWLIFIE
jgi:hypothetical protein